MCLCKLLQDSTNVYRTKHYIIKQLVGIRTDAEIDNAIFSQDTFIRRTKARDREYENIFKDRLHIDGKRLPSTMCSRKYID